MAISGEEFKIGDCGSKNESIFMNVIVIMVKNLSKVFLNTNLMLGKQTICSIILILILILAVSPYHPRSSAATKITFEDLLGTDILDTDYLRSFGLVFNSPRIVDYSSVNPNFPASGSKAAVHCFQLEDCPVPLIINFQNPQSHVKVLMGYPTSLVNSRSVVMRAFDANDIQIAQAVANLGPVPDFQRINIPLEVSIAEQQIRKITVGFALGGFSNANLAIDDLEFDNPGGGGTVPCASMRVPWITLSNLLVAAEPTQINRIVLTGVVSTDSPLLSAKIFITGASGSRLYEVLGRGIPANGGLFVLALDDVLFEGSNNIRITAENCLGQNLATVTKSFNPIVPGTRFIFMGMEVTQAIQDVDNSVRLIADKRTIVRVYLRTSGPTDEIFKVGGLLTAFRERVPNTSLLGEPIEYGRHVVGAPTGLQLYSYNTVTVNSDPDIKNKRDSKYLSINFELPPEWIRQGRVHFSFEPLIEGIESTIPCEDHRLFYKERGCENMRPQSLPDLAPSPVFNRFWKGASAKIVLVGFPYTINGVTDIPTQQEFDNIASTMRSIYPDANIQFSQITLGGTGFDFIPECELLNYILWVGQQQYGWSPVNSLDGTASYGFIGINVGGCSYGYLRGGGGNDPLVAVHEITHGYGYAHDGFDNIPSVPCKVGLQDGSAMDLDYPYAVGSIGEFRRGNDIYFQWVGNVLTAVMFTDPNFGPYVGIYGFDVDAKDPLSPNIYKDLMAYCYPKWISDYVYEKLFFRLHEVKNFQNFATARSSSLTSDAIINETNPGLTMLIAGDLFLPDNKVDLKPIYILPETEITQRPLNRTFAINLLDSNGTTVATYPFQPMPLNDGVNVSESRSLIFEAVPFLENTTQITITKGDIAFATRNISDNKPVVQVVLPKGGEFLDGKEAIIAWNGTDLDGDDLTYLVYYSRDFGNTWQTIGADIKESSLTVNLEDLPGGDKCLIKVVASDGVNTSFDISDESFKVLDKNPIPRILSPVNDSESLGLEVPVLTGEGYDVEDGYLNDSALYWQSDKQGMLGIGHALAVTGMMPGEHEITLIAKDRSGRTGVSEPINISVAPIIPIAYIKNKEWAIVGSSMYLDGSRSIGSGDLLYDWKLIERPVGSKTEISASNISQAAFVPDLTGTYEIQLTVMDKANATSVRTKSIQAIRSEDFKPFDLSWSRNGANYTISGRSIDAEPESFTINFANHTLILSVDGKKDGKMEVNVPNDLLRDIVAVRSAGPQGEMIRSDESSNSNITRLEFSLPNDTSRIEIVAVCVVEEFHTFNAWRYRTQCENNDSR